MNESQWIDIEIWRNDLFDILLHIAISNTGQELNGCTLDGNEIN